MPEPPQEASGNLRQPEMPYDQSQYGRKYTPRLVKRTGRVVQFATRVTPEFDKIVRSIVLQENIYLSEVLERMLEAYLAQNPNKYKY